MRICFVSHSSGDGGAERVLLETIELLQARGIECQVILPTEGSLGEELARLGVHYSVISFPLWMARGKVSRFGRLQAAVGIVKDTFLVGWQILRWKCDVVYSNTSTVSVGAFAAFIVGRPHVWHLHEFGLEDQGLSFLFGERRSLALIDRLSARCICVSQILAENYAKSIDASKIAVIYPSMCRALEGGEEPARVSGAQSPPSKKFRCLIVGALIPGKGQEEAILAMAHLKKTGVAAELTIVGQGEAEFQLHLQKLVQSNALTEDVVFAGQVKNAFPVMLQSDVILVCSKAEAFGRVTVEGMFAAKPVIGARSGATAELIKDGINGLLYRSGDAGDLAERIRFVYENPTVAEAMGTNARTWVQANFNADRISAELLNVLHSAADRTEVTADLAH